MTTTSIVAPNRRYWLLAALGLPLANLGALAGVAALDAEALDFVAIGVLLVAELVALAIVLLRRGYAGVRLWAWLVAGAGSTVAVTVVLSVVAVVALFLIAAAGCPPDAYECPV